MRSHTPRDLGEAPGQGKKVPKGLAERIRLAMASLMQLGKWNLIGIASPPPGDRRSLTPRRLHSDVLGTRGLGQCKVAWSGQRGVRVGSRGDGEPSSPASEDPHRVSAVEMGCIHPEP